jgi:hypothetical protein
LRMTTSQLVAQHDRIVCSAVAAEQAAPRR